MYAIITNFPGRIPDSEPIEVETIEEVKQVLQSEVQQVLDSDFDADEPLTFHVSTPLDALTDAGVKLYGAIYGYYSDGMVLCVDYIE